MTSSCSPALLKDYPCQVIAHRDVGSQLKLLTLKSQEEPFNCLPGQFVMLDLPELQFMFRRPFSVMQVSPDGTFDIYYKIVGHGTAMMADLVPGNVLKILGPLGNSFVADPNSVLVGGGIGIAPLLMLGQQLVAAGGKPWCVYGVRNASEIGLYEALTGVFGERLLITTDDGSAHLSGNVITALSDQLCDVVKRAPSMCVCGPTPMMSAVSTWARQQNPKLRVQVSLEEHMPCGTGACSGCVVFRVDQDLPSKVCVDGPVFDADLINWRPEVNVCSR